MPANRDLELFVYVLGLEGSPFAIDIESSKTTDRLKNLILNERPNDLKGVDAARLTLYKVCLRGDRTISATAPEAIREDNLMEAAYPLSKYFHEQPPAEMVHVVVGLPDEFGEGEYR